MRLTRLLRGLTGRAEPSPALAALREATRHRDAGRFEEAAELVAVVLRLNPDSVAGHLLAASLHGVFRDMARAREDFERALALDPGNPRALLGLARLALEEDDPARATVLLDRALSRYPDFPEATALLEIARGQTASSGARGRHAPVRLQAARLGAPVETRELLLARTDGSLILARPQGPRSDELAVRAAQICRLATAALDRAGLGPLRSAILEGAADTTFLRTDETILLSLALGPDADAALTLPQLERVWTSALAELAGAGT